ncbi:hypothetical protein Ancab_032184 [Ancistrocladus abbreviatus]
MFDLQPSSPTCDRLAIVSELSPLDQGTRDPMQSDFLVITMKKRKKGIVATDVQLNILLMGKDFALFRLPRKLRERSVTWLYSYMTIEGRKSSIAPPSRSRQETPLGV